MFHMDTKAAWLHAWREQASSSSNNCKLEETSIPQSYHLPLDCDRFVASARTSSFAWVMKELYMIDPKYGIKPSSNGNGVHHMLAPAVRASTRQLCDGSERIAQEFIEPLTLNGRKFDLRSYLLIVARRRHGVVEYHSFVHEGYGRLSKKTYNATSEAQ